MALLPCATVAEEGRLMRRDAKLCQGEDDEPIGEGEFGLPSDQILKEERTT